MGRILLNFEEAARCLYLRVVYRDRFIDGCRRVIFNDVLGQCNPKGPGGSGRQVDLKSHGAVSL